MDVEIDDEWKQIDSYINDKDLYEKALELLLNSKKTYVYSVAFKDGKSSCEFNFGEKGIVHMGAVVADHGSWDDLSEYIASDKYVGMNQVQLMMYPMMAAISNRNISRIREQ